MKAGKRRSDSNGASSTRRVRTEFQPSSTRPPIAHVETIRSSKARKKKSINTIVTPSLRKVSEPPNAGPSAVGASSEWIDEATIESGARMPTDTNGESERAGESERMGAKSEEKEKKEKKAKRAARKEADKLKEWLSYRDAFLHEMLRHEGTIKEGAERKCYGCEEDIEPSQSAYRCLDCIDGVAFRCIECAKYLHSNLPFHRLQCSCPGSPERIIQALRSRLFPSTLERIKTVFTFDLLEFFQELNLQGKTPIYDFYHTLLRQSDFLQLGKQPSQLNNFHRAIRAWRHLQSLKRHACAHDPAGVTNTKPGELLTECPACPHPGKNLPDNWMFATTLAYLYILFLAVDANFKLKGKDRGLQDIELSPGWGAFVEEAQYQNHIRSFIQQKEINTCDSEHDAVVRAAVRCTPGYAVTGAGLVICSRHCLIRPNGAGDLQKGERYCNMDYIIFSAFVAAGLLRLVLTYDIACQWARNYRKRLADLPKALQPADSVDIQVAIPSWHINGHGKKCQETLHVGYLNGVGRLCGDEVEQTWWSTNSLGTSVREMAPSARHETLNDQWNAFNVRKIVGFRARFAKNVAKAVRMKDVMGKNFRDFADTFPKDVVARWEKMVTEWDKDKSKPCPYEERVDTISLQDVRSKLEEEEKQLVASGVISEHPTSMLSCVMTGLDLEERQRILKAEISQLPKKLTPKQKADKTQKQSSLLRQILVWRKAQLAYMPVVSNYLENEEDDDAEIETETIPLYLPSSLPSKDRRSINRITNMEATLREAQANDAIGEICRVRRILTNVTTFKRYNLAGEGNKANTRIRSLYDRLQKKIERAAERYRTARKALLELDPKGSWTADLLELEPKHIGGPGREERDDEGNFVSHGNYVFSWIWVAKGARTTRRDDVDAQIDENLRVEWAKSRARSLRWDEEVELLQEEMRRVVVYLFWKAEWWEGKRHENKAVPQDIRLGLEAYGAKQAWYCRELARSSLQLWVPILKGLKLNTSWADDWWADIEPTVPKANPKPAAEPSHKIPDISSDSESSDEEQGYLKEGAGLSDLEMV
ncbi:hypothetical protein DFP72DRAFT_1080451 [Ephemerocybe angulata]|uniref:CxC2-like cysteine cluster KDZ transposase-associated domain-containing protein n=1 Tax=Ephemerocybe angulata TaxID=980116 RepID=A0A8H6LTI4_9AGAR|nr:hypothetical protein DFP72DRAFT_1080451 [Tulosesus angulatus]